MKIKTPANTAETYDIESTLLDISNDMESKMQAVGNSTTLLPQQILTAGEHPLYETRPLLWPVLVRPASVTIVGIIILAIAPQVPLAFIDSVVELLSLNVILSIISWTGIVVSFAGLLGVLVRFLRWKRTTYTFWQDFRVRHDTHGNIRYSWDRNPLEKRERSNNGSS